MTADSDKAAATMDLLTFLASVIGSVAWPVAAIWIAFLFRAQIVSLLERVRRLSLGGNTVEFEERLAEVESEALAAAPEPSAQVLDDRTLQLVSVAPLAAINESWVRLEIKLGSLAAPKVAMEQNWRSPPHFLHLTSAVRAAGLISPQAEALLQSLYTLRGDVLAKGSDVTTDEAVRFVTLTEKAKALIDGSDARPDPPE